MPPWLEYSLDALVLLIALASIGTWLWLLRTRTGLHLPLLEPVSRPRPYWNIGAFFLVIGAMMVFGQVGLQIIKPYFTTETIEKLSRGDFDFKNIPLEDGRLWEIVNSAASILVVTCVLVYLNLFRKQSLQEYGFWPTGRDVRLGLKAAFLIIPGVLLISTLVHWLIPYEHPVFDTLKKNPSWSHFAIICFSSVLVAPLFEEFACRALLQGSLEQWAVRLRLAQAVVEKAEAKESKPVIVPPPEIAEAEEVKAWDLWPIYVTSILFASLHLGQGAAALPIFVLSLGLGYLYRQTGRLGPSLTVHVILNAFTMVIQAIELYYAKNS